MQKTLGNIYQGFFVLSDGLVIRLGQTYFLVVDSNIDILMSLMLYQTLQFDQDQILQS
jgi:hypothetical protein